MMLEEGALARAVGADDTEAITALERGPAWRPRTGPGPGPGGGHRRRRRSCSRRIRTIDARSRRCIPRWAYALRACCGSSTWVALGLLVVLGACSFDPGSTAGPGGGRGRRRSCPRRRHHHRRTARAGRRERKTPGPKDASATDAVVAEDVAAADADDDRRPTRGRPRRHRSRCAAPAPDAERGASTPSLRSTPSPAPDAAAPDAEPGPDAAAPDAVVPAPDAAAPDAAAPDARRRCGTLRRPMPPRLMLRRPTPTLVPRNSGFSRRLGPRRDERPTPARVPDSGFDADSGLDASAGARRAIRARSTRGPSTRAPRTAACWRTCPATSALNDVLPPGAHRAGGARRPDRQHVHAEHHGRDAVGLVRQQLPAPRVITDARRW
jgi:hypothetical protein